MNIEDLIFPNHTDVQSINEVTLSDETPPGATQPVVGDTWNENYEGDKYGCPECDSEFQVFYSAKYCPVCKHEVKGRTTNTGQSGFGQFM
jgi:hypothetical protein